MQADELFLIEMSCILSGYLKYESGLMYIACQKDLLFEGNKALVKQPLCEML